MHDQQQLTGQKYRRERRDTLDALVDHGPLLISLAQRESRRSERRKRIVSFCIVAVPLFSGLLIALSAASDKVVEVWVWWTHGGGK